MRQYLSAIFRIRFACLKGLTIASLLFAHCSVMADASKAAIAPVQPDIGKPESRAEISSGEPKLSPNVVSGVAKKLVTPGQSAKTNITRASAEEPRQNRSVTATNSLATKKGAESGVGRPLGKPEPNSSQAADVDAVSLLNSEPLPSEVQNKLSPRVISTKPATNGPVAKLPTKPPELTEGELRHPIAADLAESGNVLLPPPADLASAQMKYFRGLVNSARELRKKHQPALAEDMLIQILSDEAPEAIQRDALYELGMAVLDRRDLPRTQQILAQFARKYPSDPMTAEVLLRQGLLYREMGAPSLAISKFYAVMSTALNLNGEQVEHYQRVVLLAQTEIADTYSLQGRYEDAADFYRRVLKLENPNLNEPLIRFKLIKCYDVLKNADKLIAEGQRFVERFPDDPQIPEVRFILASIFKSANRRREAIEQTMALLQAEKTKSDKAPEIWAYWQQRTGNDIGNQLYTEGDYLSALQVYRCLAGLNKDPGWEVPANYQIGLVLERLGQPEKAAELYQSILSREKDVPEKSLTPNLKLVFEMCRWRKDQLAWESSALRATREIANASVLPPVTTPGVSAVAGAVGRK